MNDLHIHDWNDAMNQDRQNNRPGDRHMEKRQKRRLRRRWGGRLFAFGGFSLLAGGLSLGAWGQHSQQQQVMGTAAQERDFVPSLRVATVEPSPATVSVTLPGTTAAFAAANIYARATGYIDKRNVDIGDRVKPGDLLAQLAVPELDDQISQAEATLDQLRSALDQAEANRKLADSTWGRDEQLVKKGWFTPQQGDIDVKNLKAQEAAAASAKHNVTAQEKLVKQLRQNRDYASVVAPFDGVITQRNVDVGSLVQGNATSGTFMFEIMQENVIRVWVYVPQDAAFGVAPGIDAVVRVPELPDREFPGTVTRIADALQPGTRTLLTEIDIPNPDGASDTRDLLHGRAPHSAQDAKPFGAGRCHHFQPRRHAGGGRQQRQGGDPQGESEARSRHAGGSGYRGQPGGRGGPQSAGQPLRRQQGAAAPGDR
jgi:RND family efflux transporter MFP subunit